MKRYIILINLKTGNNFVCILLYNSLLLFYFSIVRILVAHLMLNVIILFFRIEYNFYIIHILSVLK